VLLALVVFIITKNRPAVRVVFISELVFTVET
jgi:hypothetical protein